MTADALVLWCCWLSVLKHWRREKWLSFCRWHFQMHFPQWKLLYFDFDFTEFIAKGSINNNPSLFQMMDWCCTGDKPLSEPRMTLLTWHIHASLSLNIIAESFISNRVQQLTNTKLLKSVRSLKHCCTLLMVTRQGVGLIKLATKEG